MGLDGCWMILSGLSADTWVCSKLLMPNLSQLLGVHVFMYDQDNFLVASLVSHLRSPYLVQSRYIILYYDIQLILKSCCALENNHPKDGGTWNWEQSSGNERLSIISHKIKTLYAQTTYYRIPIIPPHLISFSEIQLRFGLKHQSFSMGNSLLGPQLDRPRHWTSLPRFGASEIFRMKRSSRSCGRPWAA